MTALVLVSCVAAKRSFPSPAAELYCSPLFRKSRAYAQRAGCRWAILSAEHGLLLPDQVVHPYETTLNRMPAAARRAWANRVMGQIQQLGLPASVTILAGTRYREQLVPALRELGVDVSVPMAGLGIGRQLAFLAKTERTIPCP